MSLITRRFTPSVGRSFQKVPLFRKDKYTHTTNRETHSEALFGSLKSQEEFINRFKQKKKKKKYEAKILGNQKNCIPIEFTYMIIKFICQLKNLESVCEVNY